MRTTLLAGLLVLTYVVSGLSQTGSAPRAPRNAAEFDVLFQQVKNWGRWGPDDQLGSVNLITSAKRKQALALAKNRRDGVAGAHAAHREGGRQQQPVRAHDAARQQHGSLRDPVSRLRPQPHRRALPHPLQGPDLQRLRARRRQHRQGLHQARHPEPQGRRRDARRAGRHPAAAQPAVSRTGHRDLRRRSRGLGEEVRRRRSRRATRCCSGPDAGRGARSSGPGTSARARPVCTRRSRPGSRRAASRSSAATPPKTSRRRWSRAWRCRFTR